tara:strand:+ start:45 stop:539 length:495 start_codon:yes stop_codon:yes gene_type:complete
MKITDNFLSDSEFKSIQDWLTGEDFHWYFNNSIANQKQGLDQFQFVHPFYDVAKPSLSKFSSFLYPFLTKLNAKYIFRIKANLRPRTTTGVLSDYHTDMDLNQQTGIFYINTNNGYTKFQDNTLDDVPSVANRFLTFSGQLKHAGASPTDINNRIVLNINYIPS